MICDWVEAECTEEYLQECYTIRLKKLYQDPEMLTWLCGLLKSAIWLKRPLICTLSFMSIHLPQISCCLAVLSYYYLNTICAMLT